MTPTSVDLSVASFNIRYGRADDGPDSWPLRKESTAAELVEVLSWDVAGLQEALQEQVDYLTEHVPAQRRRLRRSRRQNISRRTLHGARRQPRRRGREFAIPLAV